MICPVPSSKQTALLRCNILWTTKICMLEGIWFVCEEQVLDDNPQRSAWFSQWRKFPRRNSWFSGYIFSAEEFCTLAVLQESKTFFPFEFVRLNGRNCVLKLLISHKLSRMEVINFVITKEMYFGHRQITYWSSTEQFHMCCLQWHLVKFPHWYGGESYADRAGPLENVLVCSEAWSSVATTGDCLVLSDGAHQTRNSYKLRCFVFCS